MEIIILFFIVLILYYIYFVFEYDRCKKLFDKQEADIEQEIKILTDLLYNCKS